VLLVSPVVITRDLVSWSTVKESRMGNSFSLQVVRRRKRTSLDSSVRVESCGGGGSTLLGLAEIELNHSHTCVERKGG